MLPSVSSVVFQAVVNRLDGTGWPSYMPSLLEEESAREDG